MFKNYLDQRNKQQNSASMKNNNDSSRLPSKFFAFSSQKHYQQANEAYQGTSIMSKFGSTSMGKNDLRLRQEQCERFQYLSGIKDIEYLNTAAGSIASHPASEATLIGEPSFLRQRTFSSMEWSEAKKIGYWPKSPVIVGMKSDIQPPPIRLPSPVKSRKPSEMDLEDGFLLNQLKWDHQRDSHPNSAPGNFMNSQSSLNHQLIEHPADSQQQVFFFDESQEEQGNREYQQNKQEQFYQQQLQHNNESMCSNRGNTCIHTEPLGGMLFNSLRGQSSYIQKISPSPNSILGFMERCIQKGQLHLISNSYEQVQSSQQIERGRSQQQLNLDFFY